ncbi:MAG TPA: prolyl oligopeptidase family serine peptidase [Acidobacteriota bacterium]|nr:prolyl oligopeptidase family serine peptidase [Acidobacteriota bacterium]
MDRPRDRRQASRQELKRNLLPLLGLIGLVFAVALLPAGVLWFFGGVGVGSGSGGDGSGTSPAKAGGAAGSSIRGGASERPDDITFESGDAVLAGDLILPEGSGPFPAVVAVHGSGRSTRRVMRRVAEALVPRGFAVLIYDKRGVGRSSGLYSGVGPANSEHMLGLLAQDALAGVRLLASHPRIDRARIGLVGVSQAGWIIPKAASQSPLVAFAVIVSGPTVTVGEEIYYSDLTGDDAGRPTTLTDEEIQERLARYQGPDGFDPLPSLRIMKAPTLWLLGEKDRSIPIPECLAHLDELIEQGQPFRYKVYPGANHGLRLPDGTRIDYWDEVEGFIRETWE